MQAAGRLVVAGLELPAGVEHVKIISSALCLCFGCLSTGMPRPLSATVSAAPSLCSVTAIVVGVAVHRLVDGVVEDLPDEVVQPDGADAADVHAGALADGLEAFEDGDVFCGVGRAS